MRPKGGSNWLLRADHPGDIFSFDYFKFRCPYSKQRVKVLHWDHGGFVLTYKRLEAGRFRVPMPKRGATRLRLDATQLAMLLDGIDFSRVRRPRAWMPAGDRQT